MHASSYPALQHMRLSPLFRVNTFVTVYHIKNHHSQKFPFSCFWTLSFSCCQLFHMHQRRFHLPLPFLPPFHRWNNNTLGGGQQRSNSAFRKLCISLLDISICILLIVLSWWFMSPFGGKRPSNSGNCVTCKRINSQTTHWQMTHPGLDWWDRPQLCLWSFYRNLHEQRDQLFHSHPEGSVCRCFFQKIHDLDFFFCSCI